MFGLAAAQRAAPKRRDDACRSADLRRHHEALAVLARQQRVGLPVGELLLARLQLQRPADAVLQAVRQRAALLEMLLRPLQRPHSFLVVAERRPRLVVGLLLAEAIAD